MMRILVVCLGNICRSPMAEGILASRLPRGFEVDSAGTLALHQGEHPDKRAVETALNHGIDISRQKSRPIEKADFNTFDKIYCMDRQNLADVRELAENEEQRSKVLLFLEAAGMDTADYAVPDPYWSGMDGFEEVFLLLEEASEKIKTQLLTSNT